MITTDMRNKLKLIEGFHCLGWSNTSGHEAYEEILRNSRMVQVLGGPEAYLDELLKAATENKVNGRRVSEGDPCFRAEYYAKELEEAKPQGTA